MLTPKEVSERGFTKVSFGGYNLIQVDEFLDILTGDYTTLFSENTTLKRKMKVMQEKIDEYRTTEETMRKALLAAQQMAETMVQEGEKKTKEMMSAARSEIEAMRKSTLEECKMEEDRLTAVKQVTARYVEQVRELHQQEKEYLDSLGILATSESVLPESVMGSMAREVEVPVVPQQVPVPQQQQQAPAPQQQMPVPQQQAPVQQQMPMQQQQMPVAPQVPQPMMQAPVATAMQQNPVGVAQQDTQGRISEDVQMYLQRAMADALGEKKAAELTEENYGNLQAPMGNPSMPQPQVAMAPAPAYHPAEDMTPESVEATTRFLMQSDMEPQQTRPFHSEDNEYDREMAHAGGNLDFNRLQQEFGPQGG